MGSVLTAFRSGSDRPEHTYLGPSCEGENVYPESEKTDRLDTYLAAEDLDAVWFARPANFAWLTGGDNVVDREAGTGVAAAGYDGDEVRVVTDTIEAPRLAEEELPDGTPIESFPWYESTLPDAVAERSSTPAAADFEVPGMEALDPARLRVPLTDIDVERYRALGADTAAAVEAVGHEVDSGTTEREAAARLREALFERGVDSPVALVASAERAQAYRHFPPKDVELGDYGILTVTGVRDGLHASVTRTVAFDPPEWLVERHEAAMSVEAAVIAATNRLAGEGTAADLFEVIQDAYADAGYPGEWEEHHQGGLTGFAGREWKATPTASEPVATPAGYAWNPTVQGAKSEDTVLVDDGVEVLTATGEWPTREFEVDGERIVRHALGP